MISKSMKSVSIYTLPVLFIFCSVFLSGCTGADSHDETDTGTYSQAISQETVTWDGKEYVYNENLINILFLGTDSSDMLDTTYIPGDAGQSDCIIILSLDEEIHQARILQINRNTMTNIDVYNMAGRVVETLYAQIALQYAYCTGGENSCYAVKNTVSELLYGLEIAGYFTLDISGVAEINDALGGVEITLSEDYTQIDSSLTAGSTILLEGELAEKFIRYRDTDEFNSVQDRMERQVIYITALIEQIKGSGKDAVYDLLSPYFDTYILTDLTAEELNSLASYTYLTDEVAYLPGEALQGEVYEEFYADDEELQALVIEMFYTQVED